MKKIAVFIAVGLSVSSVLAQGADYYPLKPGSKKHYQATIKQTTSVGGQSMGGVTVNSTIAEEVAGPSAALGKEAILVVSNRRDSSSGGPVGNINRSHRTESYYQSGPEGVLLLANFRTPGDTIQEPESTRFEPPLLVLKIPCDSGSSWKVGTMKMQGVSVVPEAKVLGKEDVNVPGGSFKDCLKVKSSSSEVGGAIQGMGGMSFDVVGGEFSTTTWYAPGVGLVKQEVYSRFALSSPNMPQGMTAEVSFEQTQLLTKIEDGVPPAKAKKGTKKK